MGASLTKKKKADCRNSDRESQVKPLSDKVWFCPQKAVLNSTVATWVSQHDRHRERKTPSRRTLSFRVLRTQHHILILSSAILSSGRAYSPSSRDNEGRSPVYKRERLASHQFRVAHNGGAPCGWRCLSAQLPSNIKTMARSVVTKRCFSYPLPLVFNNTNVCMRGSERISGTNDIFEAQ